MYDDSYPGDHPMNDMYDDSYPGDNHHMSDNYGAPTTKGAATTVDDGGPGGGGGAGVFRRVESSDDVRIFLFFFKIIQINLFVAQYP